MSILDKLTGRAKQAAGDLTDDSRRFAARASARREKGEKKEELDRAQEQGRSQGRGGRRPRAQDLSRPRSSPPPASALDAGVACGRRRPASTRASRAGAGRSRRRRRSRRRGTPTASSEGSTPRSRRCRGSRPVDGVLGVLDLLLVVDGPAGHRLGQPGAEEDQRHHDQQRVRRRSPRASRRPWPSRGESLRGVADHLLLVGLAARLVHLLRLGRAASAPARPSASRKRRNWRYSDCQFSVTAWPKSEETR